MVKNLTAGQDQIYVPRLLDIETKPFDQIRFNLLTLPEAGGYRYVLVVLLPVRI